MNTPNSKSPNSAVQIDPSQIQSGPPPIRQDRLSSARHVATESAWVDDQEIDDFDRQDTDWFEVGQRKTAEHLALPPGPSARRMTLLGLSPALALMVSLSGFLTGAAWAG